MPRVNVKESGVLSRIDPKNQSLYVTLGPVTRSQFCWDAGLPNFLRPRADFDHELVRRAAHSGSTRQTSPADCGLGERARCQ